MWMNFLLLRSFYNQPITNWLSRSLFISHSTFPAPGAIKSVYAPEPFDVGRVLQVDIIYEGQRLTLTTAGPIDPGLVYITDFCLSSS